MDHRVVIVGAGFGGLYAARRLGKAPVSVTVIDRKNYHLFQPLLYQVATGALSPGEIGSPIRYVLNRNRNTEVRLDEVVDFDVAGRRVLLANGAIPYDELIVATGATHHYFCHDEWEAFAPGLKNIEDATSIRSRILTAFEEAEREPDYEKQRAWLTFAIVGAGPTGVELAGALAEIAHDTLKRDFRRINPADANIVLIEGIDRVLPAFPADLSASAKDQLRGLRVQIRLHTRVTAVDAEGVTIEDATGQQRIAAKTVLWAAGVKASELGRKLVAQTGAAVDGAGRVVVEPDLSIAGYPEIRVVGDLASFTHQGGRPLPGVAPVAIQQGRYVAKAIVAKLRGEAVEPFRYLDKGNLATIGRNRAVAEFGSLHFSGFPAWFLWVFVHLMYLVEFDNRLLVLTEWIYNYVTRNRGARLITGR